jgi:hypothetical protein
MLSGADVFVFVGPEGYADFEYKRMRPKCLMLFLGLHDAGQEEISFVETLPFVLWEQINS